MPHAMVVRAYGGPEVLVREAIEVGSPSRGQVRIRHTAIGVNFSDVYRRRGTYRLPLPLVVGSEGAGVVTEVGPGVTAFKAGDRIAYGGPLGSYCDERLVTADQIVKIPDGITDEEAAAMMLKGLTVHYLLHWTYPVKPGDTVVIHAAAGGVGLIFCQWASHLGATVIGTVGSDEKAEIARAHGCHHPIVYTREDFADRVMKITDGAGAHAVYDSVGKDTILKSIACTRPRGTIASFGGASGPIAPLDTGLLAGSKFFTKPSLGEHTATPEMLATGAGRLFDLVLQKKVKIEVNHRYRLADAADAHRALESRATTGSTVLLP